MKTKSFCFPIYHSPDGGVKPFKRFERISNGFGTRTVVKIKKGYHGYIITIADVKWSRYRLINLLKKLFLIIKYSI